MEAALPRLTLAPVHGYETMGVRSGMPIIDGKERAAWDLSP
jgi:hypothetical protein